MPARHRRSRREPPYPPTPGWVPEGVFLVGFDHDARFDSLGRIQFTTFWHGRRTGAPPNSPSVCAQVSHTDLPSYLRRYQGELGYRVVFITPVPAPHPSMPPLPALDTDWPPKRAPAGLRLVYAYVSTDDILRGIPGSVTDTHPIAMAVRRALSLGPRVPPHVGVGHDWFSINVQGSFWESHDLPPGTRDWTRAYDHREHVRPFWFTFTTAWGGPR